MEQKMGKDTGLTPRQKQLLAVALEEPYILKNFYLSGGTALASWYLHHRESYDLDFFSTTLFDSDKINEWFMFSKVKIGFQTMRREDEFGFHMFILDYPTGERLAVDFVRYTTTRLKTGIDWNGLTIDSLYDIAINKLQTISERPRSRDYIDLYCILTKTRWSIHELLPDVMKKFPVQVDEITLVKNFLKVVEYTDYPKMLVPLDEKKMIAFYEDLARSLRPNILK